MVRVGAVSYLNTRPLVAGLERGAGAGRLKLSYAVPSALAEQMAAGLLEIALLPVIELARFPDLEIVPGLAIGTLGPSRSVLLVGRGPLARVRSVALDAESRTSNALARVLLHRAGIEADFVTGAAGADLAATLEQHDAAVRIGDKALFEPLPPGAHALDLGTAWTEVTGLPFVFAVWAARPGVVDREIYEMLHASRRLGGRLTDEIAADYVFEGRRDPELARDYLLRNIRFRLGADELRALRLFFDAAAELGLIAQTPPLRMALERRSACHETAERLRGEHAEHDLTR